MLNDTEEINCSSHLAFGETGELRSCLKTQHSKKEDHGILSHHLKANRRGKSGSTNRFYFLGLEKHCEW